MGNHSKEITSRFLSEGSVCVEAFIKDQQLVLNKIKDLINPHPLLENLKGNPGVVIFSSGTTGEPKAMLHDFIKILSVYSRKSVKDLCIVLFLFFDHVGGVDTLLRGLISGMSFIVLDSRKPQNLAFSIERYKADVLPASPTALNLLSLSGVLDQYDLSSLKFISYGAEPMPQVLLDRLIAKFPHVDFQQKFGISETYTVPVRSRSKNSLDLKISDSFEYKIVDGELWLRAPSQFLGYLNDSNKSYSLDGWFCTGDCVKETEDGYLKILGRVNDIINVGGEKVYPSEVESVILLMDEVEDCTVYAQKNAIVGESVCAQVKINSLEDASSIRKKIKNFCRERLDGYKVPVKIQVVDEIAISARNKKIRNKI